MDIRVSKQSEVPVRQQLAEQIVYLIATGNLKPGQALPSVRDLARRLKIHHNTVSHAYQNLVRRTWLVWRRGTRVVVRSPADAPGFDGKQDLDDLINGVIREARERGHSLQALRERFRARLLTEPPDHILVVDQEPGLQRLLQAEIHRALGWPVECCAREELTHASGLVIGAILVVPQYGIEDVRPLVPKDRLTVPIAFSFADEHVERIRRLKQPSVIGVVSVSSSFLKTARSLLAPALGRRHSLREFLLPLDDSNALNGFDVIFCDSIALAEVKNPRAVHYRLVAPASLEYLAGVLESFQPS
jgi:DNA-binding transcriptional regulator YhcF (GntR family)